MSNYHLLASPFSWAIAVILLFNLGLYISQAIKLCKQKTSRDISLTLFVTFFLTLVLLVVYGLYKNDVLLILGASLCALSCSLVILLAIFYRKKTKTFHDAHLKNAREAQNDRLQVLENIIALMPGHVYWVDRHNIYQGCNDDQAKSAGLTSRHDIVGKQNKDLPWNIGAGTLSDDLDKANDDVMKSGVAKLVEEAATLKDGSQGTVLSNKVPLFSKANKVIGMVGISIDITERKMAEEATKAAKEKAEAADLSKTSFIRDMGHDFRGPITGIKGAAEAILLSMEYSSIDEKFNHILQVCNQKVDALSANETSSKTQAIIESINELKNIVTEEVESTKEMLHISKESSDRLIEFFNVILEQAESAGDKLKNKPETINVNDFMISLKEMYHPLAANKKLAFDVDVNPNVPDLLKFDYKKLQRILMNLLGNALKFTDKGAVNLIAEYKQSVLSVTVRDTADGIPEEKIETIFGSFTQLTDADRGRGGYGLGLSIVMNYLKVIGGDISVKSKLGQGSDFIVQIPVENVA